jgi:hypothetical protein
MSALDFCWGSAVRNNRQGAMSRRKCIMKSHLAWIGRKAGVS